MKLNCLLTPMGLSLIGVLSLSFSAIIFIPHLRKVVDAVEAVPCF